MNHWTGLDSHSPCPGVGFRWIPTGQLDTSPLGRLVVQSLPRVEASCAESTTGHWTRLDRHGVCPVGRARRWMNPLGIDPYARS